MRVVIRTDSSYEIGGGHVGRCLALAEALRRRRMDVMFACLDLPGSLAESICQRGFPVSLLSDADAEPAAFLAQCVERTDWLVVDQRDIDAKWEAQVRPHVGRIFAFEDRPGVYHDCDLLLDAGGSPSELPSPQPRAPAAAELLLGPRFALLRPEFERAWGDARLAKKGLLDGLVFLSSADRSNQTMTVLDAIESLKGQPLAFHLVVTPANSHRASVIDRARLLSNVTVYEYVPDMAALMARMDFAIGSGGVALWERCRMGLASIVMALAEDQMPAIRLAERAGAIRFLGYKADVDASRIAAAICDLQHDEALRQQMRDCGRRLIDGCAAERVAALMGALTLRPVGIEDARQLWHWANEPQTRSMAFDNEPIAWPDHQAWLCRKLENPDSLLFLAADGPKPVGQVRFDIVDDQAWVDISVDEKYRGRRLGTELLVRGLERLWAKRPKVQAAAYVKHGNEASRMMFRRAGFLEQSGSRTDAVLLISESGVA